MASQAKGPPYEIPDGFTDLLQRFVVHILRNQPDNLLDCATEYFLGMQGIKKPLESTMTGNSREMLYLNLEGSKKGYNENSDDSTSQTISQSVLAASKQSISNVTSPCIVEEGLSTF